MKLSHGLKLMLEPLENFSFVSDNNLFEAMRKAGKRGTKATLYPCDLMAVKMIIETVHDVTGKIFAVEVLNGNIQNAMNQLASFVKEEDYILENQYACY